MSVDLLIEQVVAPARCVVIRLLGGLDYWRYGVEEVAAHCRTQGIALLLLPGCERRDPRLAEWSTVSPAHWERMDGFLPPGRYPQRPSRAGARRPSRRPGRG